MRGRQNYDGTDLEGTCERENSGELNRRNFAHRCSCSCSPSPNRYAGLNKGGLASFVFTRVQQATTALDDTSLKQTHGLTKLGVPTLVGTARAKPALDGLS